jgi:uncharacterized protein (TIGR00375 family)
MERFIADLHVHSRYSIATSRDMDLEPMAMWARLKGIKLVATGDFTHPAHFASIKAKLEPVADGIYRLKEGELSTCFMLGTEVNNVFSQGDKSRRIHTLIFAPSIDVVEKINTRLTPMGKLGSDGRPTFTFPVKDLVKMVLDVSDECFLVPSHIWTPWYGLLGAKSGFDSIEECFGEESPHIRAAETGLSSDPQMNWRLSALDDITLISNSDAHSPSKLGREANAFACPLDYREIIRVLKEKDPTGLLFTIEFFPQEGKYHYDGHRNCNVLLSPQQTREHNYRCPVCGRPVTVGVMHRLEELADRVQGFTPVTAIPAIHCIPLDEIIAAARGVGVNSKSVEQEYRTLVERGGSEFAILLDMPPEQLREIAAPDIYDGIMRVRQGRLTIVPGYDGVFGTLRIFPEQETEPVTSQDVQMELF